MIKTSQANKVIDHIGAIYAKNDTKLLWSIGLNVDCDENQIRQLCDWSYKYDLCKKWN